MIPLDWRRVRSWNGSQDRAFEELCCQLARTETQGLPPDSRFVRRGTPDGGVECYWTLPDGEEWGWQAKFFTESPRSTQWGEMDESVKTALVRNPALKRYIICLPTLLPEDRRSTRKSARQRWNVHVEKWSSWAAKDGRSIEFVLWDESALLEMLGKPEHTGRLAFWFGGPAFTMAWFANQGVRPAIRQARTRFTPPLHVDVPLQRTLGALAKDEQFHRRLNAEGERVRMAMEETLGFILREQDEPERAELRQRAEETVRVISQWPSSFSVAFDLAEAKSTLMRLDKAATQAERATWDERATPLEDRDFVSAKIWELTRAVRELDQFLDSQELKAALSGRLIVVGEAGSGKTHLLCKTAETELALQHPAILLLGEQFSSATEPWLQIQQLLGSPAPRTDFLGALDSAGEASGSRVVILIDAINEGAGLQYWRKHLCAMWEQLRQYAFVGLIISVRDAYAHDVRQLIGDDAAWVEHHGFRGRVAEATQHFFRHYGLPEPNVPILDSEYENPLFLKLLCEALRNRADIRLSDPPNFSALLQMVLDDSNARLAVTLDYDPAERYVHRAVALLSSKMAARQADSLPWPLVIEELRKLKSSDTRSTSLAQHLLSEDLLVRVPLPGFSNGEEIARFSYQRFSDYLVVTQALQREFDAGGSGADTFQRVVSDVEWSPMARSWLEAAATISPELGGPELPAQVPGYDEHPELRAAFLHSVVWRHRAALTVDTESYVKSLLERDEEARGETFQTLLSLAARPDHPLNADWLDQYLRSFSMPERDAIWSTAIFGEWNEQGGVRRLILWAWQEDCAASVPDDVVRLAAIALIWMLTTSDRFVRDRATKALVSLLHDRVSVLRQLLARFVDVEEPYVQERLHAVACGCALLTRDLDQLNRLGQEVYDRTFRSGHPTPSVLLRDHARGVVEAARRRGTLDYEPALIIPPYQSAPPTDPPLDEELQSKFYCHQFDEAHRSLSRIYHSVTGDDFNHYVIKDVTKWSGTLDGVKVRHSPRKLFAALKARLPEDEAKFLDDLAKAYRNLDSGWLTDNQRRELQTVIARIERELPSMFGRARSRLLLTRIKPFLKEPHDPHFNDFFSLGLFKRLILQRVLDLGWRSDLFNDFDSKAFSGGRESNKPERIGKKYQWIAYDELHARISDNYGLADSYSPPMSEEDWERGLWPMDQRDIDPTLLLRSTPADGWGANHVNWWTPHNYNAWLSKPTAIEWLKSTDDVPPVEDFLRLCDPAGHAWLLLDGFHLWRKKVESEEEWRAERDRQELHFILRSYIAKAEDLPKLVRWGRKQNWINDRLPSPGGDYRSCLFEHYSSPRYDGPLNDEWIVDIWPRGELPCPLVRTAREYLCEHNTYDCSLDSTVKISIPSRWLARKLAIRPSGRHGDFISDDNSTITFDPSTRERGQGVLLVQEEALLDLLAREKLAIFWTLLGEKNYYPPERMSKWLGRQTLLGVYSTTTGEVAGSFRSEFQEGHD